MRRSAGVGVLGAVLVGALLVGGWGDARSGATVAPGRGGAARTARTAARTTARTARTAARTTVVAAAASTRGIATDQPCTATVPVGKVRGDVQWRVDDLEAAVLPQAELGAPVAAYVADPLNGGYLDNAELPQIGYPISCDAGAASARLTGYSGGYAPPAAGGFVATAAHLFSGDAGARRWLDRLVAGLRALPRQPDSGVSTVDVAALPGIPGGVLVELGGPGGPHTWAAFAAGPVVGWVIDRRETAASPRAVDVPATAARLRARIAEVSARVSARRREPFGAPRLLSAPLPLAGWGPRYAGLTWDWFFGGCIDERERAGYLSDDEARQAEERAQAARFGRLAECGAMYGPSDPQDPGETVRVITWAVPYADATGASAALADQVADAERDAGAALERFPPGRIGAERVGLRRTVPGSDGAPATYDTRVLFRRGRVVGATILHSRTDRDARDEVIRVARRLERRFARVLPASG